MPDPNQSQQVTAEDAKKILDNPYMEDTPFKGMCGNPGFGGNPLQKDYTGEIEKLTGRVESLENLIKSIFDGHVLINGQFRKITP